jgi:hypothetical protein
MILYSASGVAHVNGLCHNTYGDTPEEHLPIPSLAR